MKSICVSKSSKNPVKTRIFIFLESIDDQMKLIKFKNTVMKRTITFLAIALMVLLTGCKKINEQFENINNRLDQIEGSSLTTIDQQIKNINASLADLKSVDAALQGLIDALEAADEDHSELIAALQAKDAELDQKIADLQAYVDGEVAAVEDWAEATFATLTQYEGVQAEIAAIKLLLEQYRNEITEEYTEAIVNAIAEGEKSMKAWVNELLAEGYYDIAEIDAKLEALEAELADEDAELAKEIEDQQAALEQAKKDLTAAYEKAISEAIETNNGVINAAIAKAVQDAIDKVDTRLAVIDNTIAGIQKDIEAIKGSIASIEKQIAGINASIADLEKTDAALQALIDALEAADEDYSELIAALQAKDADLEKKISDLKAYIDGEIDATEDWAEATFATLAQYEAVQKEIAAIKALIEQNKTDLTAAYTKAIEEAIAQSETSMKAWVNELLAEGYYDIAEIDGKLAALEASLAGADAELAKDIEDQQAALEQAKKDLAAAYQKAIADAIKTNNGAIDRAIANAVNDAIAETDAKLTVIGIAISVIQKDIVSLKNSIATIEQQIRNINSSIASLKNADAALQALIDALEAADEDHSDLIAALQAKDAELEKKIAGLQAYVDGEITATEDWAEATFATLEQYEQLQAEFADIKALVDGFEVVDISVFLEALEEAIAASEESMKSWVNKLLAEGYYDIAEIDAKLAALESMIEKSDAAALAEQLKEQKEALEQAKKDLTAAYKRAIEDAIDSNNGAIDEAIAEAVQEATEKVNVKLALIEGAIADIRKEIGLLTERINSIEEQIGSINASINTLEAMDVVLKDLIDALVSTPEGDSSAELWTLIADLQAKDAELEKKISDLKAYIGKITATKDWAEATFATLEQYKSLQAEIASIKELIDQYKDEIDDIDDIEAAYTKAIADAIAASEAAMKEWVNGEIQRVYSEVLALQAKLEVLRNSAATDEELAAAVTAQQAALEQAKKDLTAAYEAAIKKAIEDNNGVIDDAIAAAITAATNNLQSEITNIKSEITSIKSRIEALEKNFANRIQSLTFVPQYSDGKILMDYTDPDHTTQAHFRISPASIAKLISAENVTAFARYTYDPTTRAFEPEFPLSVMSVTSDDSGVIEVNLKEDSNNLFDTEFWNGTKEAVVYIQITDDNGNDVVSEAIPMIAHNYVGNGNSIDGFGEGDHLNGTVAR